MPRSAHCPLTQRRGPPRLLSGYGPAGEAAVPDNRDGPVPSETQSSSGAVLQDITTATGKAGVWEQLWRHSPGYRAEAASGLPDLQAVLSCLIEPDRLLLCESAAELLQLM